MPLDDPEVPTVVVIAPAGHGKTHEAVSLARRVASSLPRIVKSSSSPTLTPPSMRRPAVRNRAGSLCDAAPSIPSRLSW
jgi:hypothetical protein